jgi:nitrite reductase/ring-hydroxylating ferredoxin subunit
MSGEPSRRQFVKSAACAACTAFIANGCGTQDTIGGGGSPDEPIADVGRYPDGIRTPMDPKDTVMPLCPGGGTYVIGPAAASVAVNTTVKVSGNVYIGRDSQGLFAIDVTCTHQGCATVLQPNSLNWVCPCHGSTFGFNGSVVQGPALLSFPKYFVCKDAAGRLVIDTSKRI